MIKNSKYYQKFFLTLICILILIISIPVISFQSGYAQIQTTSDPDIR